MLKNITAEQCRGARGILNWNQPELAQKSGVHVQTICKFEQEKHVPRQNILDKIRRTFQLSGIEFDHRGIRMRDTITRFWGREGFENFLYDVHSTAQSIGTKKKPCEVFVHNTNDAYFTTYTDKDMWDDYTVKQTSQADILDFRIFVKEGDYNFTSPQYAEYRWYPRKLFYEQCFYSYHNKLAFINFESGDAEITVHNNAQMASTFRELFRIAWDTVAIIPPKNIT